jgi:hypothetical protein
MSDATWMNVILLYPHAVYVVVTCCFSLFLLFPTVPAAVNPTVLDQRWDECRAELLDQVRVERNYCTSSQLQTPPTVAASLAYRGHHEYRPLLSSRKLASVSALYLSTPSMCKNISSALSLNVVIICL